MDLGLRDKVAIITGGSEGIGKAAASSMAQEGAKVVIVAPPRRRPGTGGPGHQGRQRGRGPSVATDVTAPDAADRVVRTARDNFGRVDILVNNAGTALAMPFEKVTDEEWEGDFDLKVWAAVRFIREVIPHMREVGGGRIINVTNLGGRTPGPSSMPTSISRAAGIAITKGLSKDLAEDNILVSTVCIGLVKSGQHQRRYEVRRQSDPGLTEDAFYDQMAHTRGVPLGRVAEAEEAGDVIAFLASARASYLTGIAVNLDGGASAVV